MKIERVVGPRLTPCVSIVDLKSNSYIDYNGGKYSGQVYKMKNIPHGYGNYIESNGNHYYGNFLYGIKNGQGQIYFKNGDHFSGKFKSDNFHGYGKMTYNNGTSYKGNFFNGQRHGKGVFIGFNNNIQDGIWEYDRFIA
jgi:hypothetical protein